MKTSFFTAIVLGLATIQQAQAVHIEHSDLDFDFSDFKLAEIEGEGKGDSNLDLDADIDGEGDKAVKLLLSSGENKCCEPKQQLPFDQQMLLALQELNGKSMTLHDALKAQFAKSGKLQNSKTMSVTGNIKFEPAGDGPLPVPQPEPDCGCKPSEAAKITIEKVSD